MAGIGFELKKLMGKGNIVNLVAGTTYAVMVTINRGICRQRVFVVYHSLCFHFFHDHHVAAELGSVEVCGG